MDKVPFVYFYPRLARGRINWPESQIDDQGEHVGDFGDPFTRLKLYQELGRSAGRDDIDAAEVTQLQGLVVAVAEEVGPVLDQIGKTFHQYTGHDIRHSRNVADRMGRLIPPQTLRKMNAVELTFLLLSASLHDVGMAVTDAEKGQTLASPAYKRFCEESHSDRLKAIEQTKAAEPWRARLIEDALLAEFYRRLHAGRVRKFLAERIASALAKIPRLQHSAVLDELGDLCESHAWGVRESNDPSDPEKAVSQLPCKVLYGGAPVNLQYLACCLRLADIMDFDRSRTPLTVFQHLTFTEERSWQEWNKHLEVKGWELKPDRVAFDIPCSHPAFFVAVQEFLGWIDDELRSCRELVEKQPEEIASRYQLRLPQLVDRSRVRMRDRSYLAGAFRFQLEYDEILRLLMDKSLYPDPSLFLRELLQNSLDACRRKEAEAKLNKKGYEARIVARDLSSDPSDPRIEFEDNGVGMSLRIVEQYFLRVGKSYYRSQEFDAERRRLAEAGIELDACSQFGIGILSCFLVCDRFEVFTRQEGGELLHLEVEGPSKYFSIRKLGATTAGQSGGATPLPHGTCVVVHLWLDSKIDCAQVLDTFAVNVDYPIEVEEAGGKSAVTIAARRWEGRDICKDFPSIALIDSHSREGKPVPTAPLFVASRIPFEAWDFSRHLKGRTWLWLLRGQDGRPTWASGYLSLEREQLKLCGVAAFLCELQSYASTGFQFDPADHMLDPDQLKRIADALERSEVHYELSASDLDGEEEVELWTLEMSPSTAEDLIDQWACLNPAERAATIECLRQWRPPDGRLWFQNGPLLRQLLDGSLAWAKDGVEFLGSTSYSGSRVAFAELAHSLALGSIHLPAGIVSWEPQAGRAEPVRLLGSWGGVQIDLRGPSAPRPGASRLWVDLRDAEGFLCSFYRGLVRHGADLASEGSPDKPWRKWLRTLLREVPEDLAEQVRGFEAPYLAERVGYLCLDSDGSEVVLAKSDVPETWRVWRNAGEGKPGVFLNDNVNWWLLRISDYRQVSASSPIDWTQTP